MKLAFIKNVSHVWGWRVINKGSDGYNLNYGDGYRCG